MWVVWGHVEGLTRAAVNACMLLLDHVSITVCDVPTVRGFYDAIMTVLGAERIVDQDDALSYAQRSAAFDTNYVAIYYSPEASSDPARHWSFRVGSRDEVEQFYAVGMAAGGSDLGAPALRPNSCGECYSALLTDPEGNHVEAVYRVSAQV